MSTRANVILQEDTDKLYFYRHSDGYPSGTMPSLEKFVQWMKDGKIRNNISQGAGWLIIIGALEYATIPEYTIELSERFGRTVKDVELESIQPPIDWKVGAYEPTTDIHGDIEYLYTIDLTSKTIDVQKVTFNYDTKHQSFRKMSASELK